MLNILSPVQDAVIPPATLAPRLASLEGKVIGLYSNRKLNADRLLELVAENLAALGAFTVQKGNYYPERLMLDEEWGDVDACDAVILANGDCGACSSSGLANAIDLEKRGIPTLLISTPPFTEALHTMARLRGMPEIGWGIVEHPIGSAKPAELAARAKVAAEDFMRIILKPGASGKSAALAEAAA